MVVGTVTVVVAGSFFTRGGFSPIDAPTHFKVIAALTSCKLKNIILRQKGLLVLKMIVQINPEAIF